MHFENSKYFLLLGFGLVITFCGVESVHVCGDGLSDMMARICTNGFNYRLKRSDTRNNNNALIDLEKQPLLYAILGESARNQLLFTRRRRFSIVDECCVDSCPTSQLREYCL
ncbi:probable insulin-like peptide 5 [Drosophila sulfurigaster albostrigata]|uniref:probable insulin-like peptide 5 n=1 Tax=Drosophila sulfurigaster albostrigata TaxID=89887 RepID=UPI002D21BE39|nr:probable insulin-like peptide 5 [Drosophila sulfurigaster albostrigata]